MGQVVWYFNVPTIGYCPDCGVTAIYTGDKFRCPKCLTTKLSMFKWDEETRHPEDES